MTQFGIGQPVRRVEDRRFLTGRGHYLDDIVRPRQAHTVMLRSPHAHARIRAIDTTAAAGPGILAILTGADLAKDGIGTIPCMSGVANRDKSAMATPPRHAIAQDRVRHVGDTVAMVVAAAQALLPGRPAVWDEHPGNLCFDWEIGDRAAAERAAAAAPHRVTLTVV